jgi:hypothetical protein
MMRLGKVYMRDFVILPPLEVLQKLAECHRQATQRSLASAEEIRIRNLCQLYAKPTINIHHQVSSSVTESTA